MPYILTPLANVQLVFEGRHDGQQTITVATYRNDKLTNTADGRAQIVAFLDWVMGGSEIYQAYLDAISSDVKNVRCFAQVITPLRYAYVRAVGDDQDGSIAGACMPSNISQVVTRRGDLADRRNVSTLHLPGVPVAGVVDSLLTNAQLDRLQTFGENMLQEFVTPGGAELRPVAFRRTDPVASRPLTETFPQPTVRILRRRTVGLGT